MLTCTLIHNFLNIVMIRIFFLQLLLYQVLCKYFPSLDSITSENNFLEKRCFWNLKSYLEKNPDCLRYDLCIYFLNQPYLWRLADFVDSLMILF